MRSRKNISDQLSTLLLHNEHMIEVANRRRHRHKSDLLKLLTRTVPLAVVISAVGLASTLAVAVGNTSTLSLWGNVSYKIVAVWASTVFSYTGLLLVSYNMMFMIQPITLSMVMWLGSGIPVGVAAAIPMVLTFGDIEFAILALCISCWVLLLFSYKFIRFAPQLD